MVDRIAKVEAVECASEHEAAWLERNLLERHLPPWNRTPGGQEVAVCIRLDGSSRSAGITVVHLSNATRPRAGGVDGVHYFGPYLGGARVRQAAAGLHRILPLAYAGEHRSAVLADLARKRGVDGGDRGELLLTLRAVLEREPAAIADLRAQLTTRRDAAAASESFELAARIQAELAALDWITCPQRAAALDSADADIAGWADGTLVRFDVRGGMLCGWRQFSRTRAQAERWLAATPPVWRDFADSNAALASRLAQP
jgi:excinuclease ABC subunit C